MVAVVRGLRLDRLAVGRPRTNGSRAEPPGGVGLGPSSAGPRLRALELFEIEDANLARNHPRGCAGGVPHRLLVGDGGEPLPRRAVLQPDGTGCLYVLPERAEVEAAKIGISHDEEAHLLAALHLRANRIEDAKIVVAAESPGEAKAERA